MHIVDTNGAGALQQGWPRLARGFVRFLASTANRYRAWLHAAAERAAGRRTLALLDERLLCDIGITRADADAEAGKPFWLD